MTTTKWARRFLSALMVACLLAPARGPSPVSSQPAWALACGDGRVDKVVDDYDSNGGTLFKADPSIPAPTLQLAAGCHGSALAIGYDLTNVAPPQSGNAGQSWVVVRRPSLIADFRPYTHIRLAIRGSNINSHDTVDVKLRDGAGRLAAISLKSLTDLPVWRALYIDLRELSGVNALDLANITDFEIGIVRCAGCEVFDNPGLPAPTASHTGTLYLDEFAALDLKPGAANRLAETGFTMARPASDLRASTSQALLAQITSAGPAASLIPAWFPEPNPNYNTYAQAEALLVFVYEFERTGNIAYRDAARNLAAKLLSLQIPAGRIQAGAWYTAYGVDQGALRPPNRALPAGQTIPCDGNETMVPDPITNLPVAINIDACEWVGNVGWALIALGRLQQSGFYHEPLTLKNGVERGAAWIIGQPALRGNTQYPGLISLGIEGNISAHFGLRAAGKHAEAAQLGDAIFLFGWDQTERRMKPGVNDFATALDVSGSWGVTFLRAIGKTQEALDSQGYTASILRTTSFDGSAAGYGDIAGPYTVSVEFSAQAAAAGIYRADFVMQQISALQIASGQYAGAFPGAPDHWYGGQLTPWDTAMPGVSPTAWMYFASRCDPLRESLECSISLPIIRNQAA